MLNDTKSQKVAGRNNTLTTGQPHVAGKNGVAWVWKSDRGDYAVHCQRWIDEPGWYSIDDYADTEDEAFDKAGKLVGEDA